MILLLRCATKIIKHLLCRASCGVIFGAAVDITPRLLSLLVPGQKNAEKGHIHLDAILTHTRFGGQQMSTLMFSISRVCTWRSADLKNRPNMQTEEPAKGSLLYRCSSQQHQIKMQ